MRTIATHLALMFALVMLSIHVSDLHANAKAKAFLVMVIVTPVTNTKTRIEKNIANYTTDPRVWFGLLNWFGKLGWVS